MPAHAAALACIYGVDFLHPARCFLLQPLGQDAPAGGKDQPVQPGLGTHAPPGLSNGASRRARHVPYPQVLYPDHIEPAGQVGRELFGPVLARSGVAGLDPCDGELYLSAAVAAAFGLGELALKRLEPTLPTDGKARTAEHLPGGQSRADRDTAVHAHHLPSSWARDGGRDDSEWHVPAAGSVQFHPERPGFGDGAGPAEPYPACFRDEHLPPMPAQPLDLVRPEGYDPEPLIAPRLAPGGFTVGAGEIVCHSLGVIPQRLLLDDHAALREPLVLLPRRRKLTTLLHPAWRAAAARPPPRLLLHRKIPHKAGMHAMAS